MDFIVTYMLYGKNNGIKWMANARRRRKWEKGKSMIMETYIEYLCICRIRFQSLVLVKILKILQFWDFNIYGKSIWHFWEKVVNGKQQEI